MPDLSALSDQALSETEAGLHRLVDRRRLAGLDISEHLAAHDLLAKELDTRGLVYKAMAPARAPGKMNTATGKDGDDDDDDDQTNDEQNDPDNDGGVSQGSESGNSEARHPTERQTPNGKPAVTNGPFGKAMLPHLGVGNSGSPNRGDHPSKDDGVNQKGKTHRGKGGEKNRTQDGRAGDVDGDTDDENDGTLGYIKSLLLSTSFAKAADDDPEDVARAAYLVLKAVIPGTSTPHEFQPVRNICRNCRQPGGDGHDDSHDFMAVRNVCRVCKGPNEDHVSKAIGADGSIFQGLISQSPDIWFSKELPQLDNQTRMKMAEQGIALPDGSFPIPNEAFLHAAIGLLGQAPDPQAAMNHIIERAQAMGMEHALPEAWGVTGPNAQGPPAAGPGAHAVAGAGAGQLMTASNASGVKEPGGTGMPTPGDGTGNAPGGGQNAGGSASTPSGGTNGVKDGTNGTAADGLASSMGSSPNEAVDPMKQPLTKAVMDDGSEMVFFKSGLGGDRYTLAPIYSPNTKDAHSEWATPEDLQKSMWDYVANTGADRTVYLQHSDQPAGKWVDIVTWPFPVEAQMLKSVDGVQKAESTTLPAGTAYMGIRWEPWAFEAIEKGALTGLSMGGKARRIEAEPVSA
jgi:hypothetical protein